MALLKRILKALPLLLVSPIMVAMSWATLLLTDLVWFLVGRRRKPADSMPRTNAATVVIPNWNGRDLLDKYLPSVEAALAGNPENEILVVDNGSTDESLNLLQVRFPKVRVLALPHNLGFGGGSNAGFAAAKNDIVVLLNSDMRVDQWFLAPLLDGFTDERVFAVSCQIFFSDPKKQREETGLTQAWWQDGALGVRHRLDDNIREPFPCFYGGGGSCAFDRRKFLELGGFDHLLAPFYLEDTDLGFMAWKRGWKVLYQPLSVVYHEHRGTIGKKFSQDYIQGVLKKNFLLFCWKNIHEWPRLGSHFFFTWSGAVLSVLFGDAQGRANLFGFWRAFQQLPAAARSRWRALGLAQISDTEAFKRPMGGYFHDRFSRFEREPEKVRVLFVSPYPIAPPIHGGGVFMYQTLRELGSLAEVHVLEMLDYAWQKSFNDEMTAFVSTVNYLVRPEGRPGGGLSILPHAVREFANGDFEWMIHRELLQRRIDVLQLEYTPLGQYRGEYRNVACVLFEHDVYFQSIARGLDKVIGTVEKVLARLEYLRALRFELRMLPKLDRVQVCTLENGEALRGFAPKLGPKLQAGLRAGIETKQYAYPGGPREPMTMLFLGSFRHVPNQVALDWFLRSVLPLVVAEEPRARLLVAGSEPPPRHAYADYEASIELLGFVEDIQPLFGRAALFICPILHGSGVRVKLLEAFAAGIPVVSTRIGAEGLARVDGEICALADTPEAFAHAVVRLLRDEEAAKAMAARAREEVVKNWDMAAITRKLEASYREVLAEKRATSASSSPEHRRP